MPQWLITCIALDRKGWDARGGAATDFPTINTGNLGIRPHVQVYDIQNSKGRVLHTKGKPIT